MVDDKSSNKVIDISEYEDLKDKNLSTGCSAKIIRLTLSDDLKREFLYIDNSFDLIKDIEIKFKRTTIIDIINIKPELYTFKETDPMTMISRFKSVVMQLKQLDQIINDTEMCHIILTKLDTNSHNGNKNYQIKRKNVKSQLCYNCRGTGHQAKVCLSTSNYVNFSVKDDVDNIID
uniref:CCHC-type domain-containing protein n=1 Tax=Strongyloides venezuelensis TaxID=75913 RepID=A0A0K0FQS9_STRVS